MSSPALDTSNFSLVASENVMHNVADSEDEEVEPDGYNDGYAAKTPKDIDAED